MSSEKPWGGLPLFTSKKSGPASGKKSIKDLLLILVPLFIGGLVISWGLGRLVGHRSTPEELFPVVFQGPGQARRAALGEWAYQLQSLPPREATSPQSPWVPSATQIRKLKRLLAESETENDPLYRSSLIVVLGFSQELKDEVIEALTQSFSKENIFQDPQSTIQTLVSLARLKDQGEAPPGLLPKLQGQADPSVRKALAFSLGAGLWASGNAVRPTLYTLAHDPADDVRWNAGFALAAKQDPESFGVLRELAQRAESMRAPGAEALTSELLSAFTESFRWSVRSGDPSLLTQVKGIAHDHPNIKIRQAALAALEVQK
jgi:hypothetical protein